MDQALDKLKTAAIEVVAAAEEIKQNLWNEINSKSPIVVHQRFCHKLVEIVKRPENANKAPIDIEDGVKIMNAIEMLEECYPVLKEEREARSKEKQE